MSSNACVSCPAGTTNAAGDDPLGDDTSCDATLCAENEYVSSNACVSCPSETTNAAGDDASGADTSCSFTIVGTGSCVAPSSCFQVTSTSVIGDYSCTDFESCKRLDGKYNDSTIQECIDCCPTCQLN